MSNLLDLDFGRLLLFSVRHLSKRWYNNFWARQLLFCSKITRPWPLGRFRVGVRPPTDAKVEVLRPQSSLAMSSKKTATQVWVCACFATKLALSPAIWADDVLVHEADGRAQRVSPRYLFIFIYLISRLSRRERYTQFQAEKASTRVAFDKFYNTPAVCEREWAARLATAAHSPARAASSLQTHHRSIPSPRLRFMAHNNVLILFVHNENKKPLKLNTQFWLTASSVCRVRRHLLIADLYIKICCLKRATVNVGLREFSVMKTNRQKLIET